MTGSERVERQLQGILEDLAAPRRPDYLDDLHRQLAATRQRSAWPLLERWLPVTDYAGRSVPAPRLPLRAIGAVLLIAALLLATLVVVGSRTRIPPPFGPAGNGLITWALDGDIFVGDPVGGTVKRVVATDDLDRNPSFSPDGTHIVFLRQVSAETGQFDLVLIRADGSASTVLTAVPIAIPEAVEWAPDGRSLLVNDSHGVLTRHFVDGSTSQLVLEGVHLEPDAFRPPDGSQILYERADDPGALYVMNADGSAPRQVFAPTTAACGCSLAGPARWSPDGRSVAFAVHMDGTEGARISVLDIAAGSLRQLANEEGAWVENDPTWSPDGTRIAFNRWQNVAADDWSIRPIAIVAASGGAVTPVGLAPISDGALIVWSPDGSTILSLPGSLTEAFTWAPTGQTIARPILFDVTGGTSRQLDWSVGSISSWQRVAR
jgi:hypothetical protein